MSNAVTFEGIRKTYPGVTALDDVSFTIREGSCHALLGENGAGKSTLGKILSGLISPDGGKILLFGKEMAYRSPLEARRAGVTIVHQELVFCENLNVAENLCLGQMPHRGPWLDQGAMRERALKWLRQVDPELDPDVLVGTLPLGLQQLVQIAGAIGQNARVIVFDEPTSSLSQREALVLFEQIEHLKAQGVTCIYVSHRMEEIFRLCDTVTVLRDGRHIATVALANTSRDSLIQRMVGREIEPLLKEERTLARPMLVVKGLSSSRSYDIGFEIQSGEVLGLAGIVGSGRTETAEAIFGLQNDRNGDVTLDGTQLTGLRPEQRMAAGLGFLPEDRKRLGLVLSMNVRENTTLTALRKLSSFGLVRTGSERALATKVNQEIRTKAASLESNVQTLSGGNQQKVALAKWLASESKVLILDEPTRGVDVGAKREIHQIIRHLAAQGKAILLISSELPELLAVSDRVMVLKDGRQVVEFQSSDVSETELLRAMTEGNKPK